MITKFKSIFQTIIASRKLLTISSFVLLILLLSILNFTFSAFTNTEKTKLANIKVSGMEYSLAINGSPETTIISNPNYTTKSNISIFSFNNIDSKYELIYKVCSNESCTSFIDKPEGLSIEYSSKTVDNINGNIEKNGHKNIRIIVTNSTNQRYYIKLDINAGYIHNTLVLKNLISNEYNEEDLIIAAIVDGEISTTFPQEKSDYETKVECVTNEGPSNATGIATWNNNKWLVNITGVDTGRTICNVYFFVSLKRLILSQGGGSTTIESKGIPDYNVINGTSGLYASPDEYGTSYYYRGLKESLNNNLIWGGFQWKIVRVNGDGSVRIIYNGTVDQFNATGKINDTGPNTQIRLLSWNKAYDDAKYMGYMFGGEIGVASTSRHGTMSTSATNNQTSSNVKNILDEWYLSNIFNKDIEKEISNNLFCNDRQLRSEVGGSSTGLGYGKSETYYAAWQRLNTTKKPTLKCGLKNDRFTTSSDVILGNGALIHPVGLLSADEAIMGGIKYDTLNTTNYLYTNHDFTTISPNFVLPNGMPLIYSVNSSGGLTDFSVGNLGGIRPVISVNINKKLSGDGSSTNPFVASS